MYWHIFIGKKSTHNFLPGRLIRLEHQINHLYVNSFFRVQCILKLIIQA